jgi:hypothetical protein
MRLGPTRSVSRFCRSLRIVDGRLGARSEDSRDVKHEWRVRSREQFDWNFKRLYRHDPDDGNRYRLV